MDNYPPPAADTQTQNSESMALQLLEDLNLTHVTGEAKDKLIERIADLIDKEVMYAVMSRLTDDDVAALEEHLKGQESDNPFNEETVKFLQTRIPDLKDVIEQALASLYDKLKETNDIMAS